MSEGRIIVRPDMLEKPVEIYDYDISRYPDRLRVSFADGRTVIYEARVQQPAPVIVENIKIIRKMKQGYVNRPERRRRAK